jgi:hypothetical protein
MEELGGGGGSPVGGDGVATGSEVSNNDKAKDEIPTVRVCSGSGCKPQGQSSSWWSSFKEFWNTENTQYVCDTACAKAGGYGQYPITSNTATNGERIEEFVSAVTVAIPGGVVQSARGLEAVNDARLAAKAIVFAERNASELKSIYGWGTGLKGVQSARGALDATAMARIQSALSRVEVEAARDMYRAAAALDKGGQVAAERAAYMEQILSLWE